MMSRSRRISLLLALTVAFFFVELAVGYVASSIALLADAFHMLNDVLSMGIALYAIKLGKRKNRKAQFTYGWQRAEILGALINGVFLLALCFSVILQAVQRFMEPVEIRHPVLMLSVGAAGLAVNLFGLFLFHEHGHGHGHGHSLGRSRKHSHGRDEDPAREAAETIEEIVVVVPAPPASDAEFAVAADEDDDSPSAALSNSLTAPSGQDEKPATEPNVANGADDLCVEEERPRGAGRGGHMNMRGVFLHVLGDALGSVGVITAGLVIWLTDLPWRFYMDPIITLVFAGITLSTTIPLVRSTCSILLQGVPSSIRIEDVRAKIMKIQDVISIHELHLWTLSEHVWIASVHVMVSPSHFMRVATDIKRLMHQYGVHSTTVQPEFVHGSAASSIAGTTAAGGEENEEKVANERESGENACLLRCAEACTTTSVCCPP